jgi:competence ComEA-like helix-hairpin-helix protein
MPKIRPLKIRLPISWPILTAAEKTALGILLSLILTGAILRAWEHSGVALGPVQDWDSLRRWVIAAPKPAGDYPCAEAALFPEAGFASRGTSRIVAKGRGKGFSGSTKKVPPARPLDLNTATERQFTSLPGVGPSTARAIVTYRLETGKFEAPEDLLKVKGIGPKKFEALQKFIRVKAAGGETPDSGR